MTIWGGSIGPEACVRGAAASVVELVKLTGLWLLVLEMLKSLR